MNNPHESTAIRTVIADDEPSARRGVELLLNRDPEIRIVGEAASGEDAVKLLRRERPDLAFLDVQMPAGDGFDVLKAVEKEAMPVVVFVTAYDEYALRAFDVNAVDYLLKPYDDARFAETLNRAKATVRQRRAAPADERVARLIEYLQRGAPPGLSDRILVKSSGEVFFLKPEEIDWVEAEGDYMKFHVAGRSHLMRETMARLSGRLDPRRFVRIHRSTIVNIDRVHKLSPSIAGDYTVHLRDGTRLRLSRGFHNGLAELLRQAR
jgi:two-component system LytT family response regulator